LAVFVVYAAALVHGLTIVSFPASASVLKMLGHLTDAQYGSIFIPQMLATILGSLIASQLGARAASGRVLTLSLVCACVAECLLALVPHGGGFPLALAATFATGLGFGLAAAPLNSFPRQLFPARPDTALVALHTVLASGFAVGPLIASAVMSAGLWSLLPAGAALAALTIAAGAWLSLPAVAAIEVEHEARPGSGPSSHLGLAFIVIAVLYALAEGTFANWAVVYLREERGVAEGWAALSLSVFWFALAGGRLAISVLLARFSPEAIWRLLPVLMAIAFLGLPSVRGPASGLVCFALAGLGCSAFFPLTVSLAAQHVRGGAARAGSLLTAALMVGVGVGSFVIGPLRGGASLATLYRLSSAYPLAALGVCLWLALRGRRAAQPSQ
jgi:fucose permease